MMAALMAIYTVSTILLVAFGIGLALYVCLGIVYIWEHR